MSNPRDWEDLVSRLDGVYTVEDFETAAYRLVAEQVIYHSDRSSRVTYGILDLYEREFSKVLAPLGVSLSINPAWRACCHRPPAARQGSYRDRGSDTVCLGAARLVRRRRAFGGLTEDGEVLCDYIELQEKFHLMTGRDLPTRGELDPAALCQALGHRSASGRR